MFFLLCFIYVFSNYAFISETVHDRRTVTMGDLHEIVCGNRVLFMMFNVFYDVEWLKHHFSQYPILYVLFLTL